MWKTDFKKLEYCARKLDIRFDKQEVLFANLPFCADYMEVFADYMEVFAKYIEVSADYMAAFADYMAGFAKYMEVFAKCMEGFAMTLITYFGQVVVNKITWKVNYTICRYYY